MPEDSKATLRLLLVVGLSALVVGSAFAWFKPLFPLLAGFFLAYVSHPLASWFSHHRLPRFCGFAVILLVLLALASLVLFVFVPALVQELALLAGKLPSWQEVVNEHLQPLFARLQERYPEAFAVVSQKVSAYLAEKLPQLAPTLAAWLGKVLLSSLSVVSFFLGLVVALVIGAYLTVDFPQFLQALRQLIPRPVLPLVEAVALEIHGVLAAFARGQLLVALALALMYTLGLWLVGTPLALVVGPLAGLLSLVPYLGLVLGASSAILLSLLEHQDLLHPLLALGVFVVAQNLEGWVLTPKLVGKGVGLHPVWVLVALLLGGQLFGMTGVVVAVPVAAALRVVLLRAVGAYRRSSLYLGQPIPAVLYTRPGCSLCAKLKAQLAAAAQLYGLAVEEVNVETDPQLAEKFGQRLPVLVVKGQEVAAGDVPAEKLFPALRRVLGGEGD